MSTESYARHICQKYCLAIALAVLKEKPHNISIEQYIEQLKNKINSENKDDLDITICSEDFDVENNEVNDYNDERVDVETQESITILKSYDIDKCLIRTESISKEPILNDKKDNSNKESNNLTAKTQDSINLLENFVFNEILKNNDNSQIDNELANNTQESITILNHYIINDIFHVNNTTTKLDDDNTQSVIGCDTNQNNHISKNKELRKDGNENINSEINNDLDATYYDSNTNCTVGNIKENTGQDLGTNSNTIQNPTQNYTHVSQSQFESIVIDENLIKPKTKSVSNKIGDKNKIPDVSLNNDTLNNKDDMEISDNVNVTSKTDTQHEDLQAQKHETRSQELIPFKVIEELNKVKNYLNRKIEKVFSNDGSIDSGYKSDSQNRSSKSSLQTVNWLNQSAHSLFDYLMHSPMIITTQEITSEVSKVLAQLVDRLHEEEKYLSFLDELLDIIDNLLQHILEGDNSEDNILLKKDETMNRLFQLNISMHIQKYTIGKLTNMLELIYTHITNAAETYEVTNTTNTENLSYIFHILEIILQRYVNNKVNKPEYPSNSQCELKKSSIVDIWRKKWYPHSQEIVGTEDITRKKCVLLKCNEVLNKYVVSCMDGYSLLSFAALRCFNLLQN